MILVNNCGNNRYQFDPDSRAYSIIKTPINQNDVSGIGWEYRKIPFGKKQFACTYYKDGEIYFSAEQGTWRLDERSKLRWYKKVPILFNEFNVIIDGEIVFSEVYFEPALLQPLNYIDITYDEMDAWIDDFFYSLKTDDMEEWIANVKTAWKDT